VVFYLTYKVEPDKVKKTLAHLVRCETFIRYTLMQKQMNMLCLSYRSELFEHKMSYIRLLSTPSKATIPAWNIENVSHHQRLRYQLGILRTSHTIKGYDSSLEYWERLRLIVYMLRQKSLHYKTDGSNPARDCVFNCLYEHIY
jgi:hypothetical protein